MIKWDIIGGPPTMLNFGKIDLKIFFCYTSQYNFFQKMPIIHLFLRKKNKNRTKTKKQLWVSAIHCVVCVQV